MSPLTTPHSADRRPRRSHLLVALAGLGLVAAACGGAATQDDTTRDDQGEVVEGGEVGSLSLKVGDCLAEAAQGEVQSVPVVPCSEPHDSELFHSFLMDGDEYPGDAKVREIANEACAAEFEAFIGIAYEDSVWDITGVFPSESTWNDLDDREVICGVFPVSGEDTAGSARGVAE